MRSARLYRIGGLQGYTSRASCTVVLVEVRNRKGAESGLWLYKSACTLYDCKECMTVHDCIEWRTARLYRRTQVHVQLRGVQNLHIFTQLSACLYPSAYSTKLITTVHKHTLHSIVASARAPVSRSPLLLSHRSHTALMLSS